MRTAITLILVLILTLTGCQNKRQKFTVGVSQCSVDNWRDKFNEELLTAALISDSLNIIIESANDDDRQQKLQIEKFIADGVDLLIVSPNQLKTISSALNKAYDRGIPIILYDRKADSKNYTAFIGCDNRQIGYAMGMYIAQTLGGKGRVAEIRGLEGSSPAIERHNGLAEALSHYPDMHIVASESGDWKQQSGRKAMKRILQTTTDIDYVFAHNDRMACGALEEAREGGLDNKMLFAGVDGLADNGGGLELVRNGVLNASYLYPTKGDEVVDLALKILTQKPFDKENFLQTSIVTHDNAELSLMEMRDAERQRGKLSALHRQVDAYMASIQSQRVITFALVCILVLLIALVAVIYRNLIAKARLNQQLDENNEKLRQLNEKVIEQTHSRLVFFTNISHELRTPLTLIIDPVEQMQADTTIRGRSRELLDLIKRNAVALQQLVGTILDLRKIQNGKMPLVLSKTDVASLIRQWVTDFEPTAQRKRVKLHILTANFTYPDIITDREKLARIVFNLVTNALKYTPPGGDVYVTLHDSPEGRFLLSVRDTGKGIAPEECPKVFERFYQSAGAQAGTGIGLALVKSYTELLQGSAAVRSEQGQGAEFIINLPREATAAEPHGDAAFVEHVTGNAEKIDFTTADEEETAAPPQPQGPTGSILVIDDNDDIRQYMRTILQTHYQVLEAPDGRRGLETARQEVPDLVLCDVMMPDISGLEVCRALKLGVATSHIPVIMLTAKALDEQRAEGYECGADSYITKPFNSKVLFARISNLLRQREILREKFARHDPHETATDATFQPQERTFMQRLRETIDRNLADSNFTVESLGSEMGLSRVQLYRKVKALTGTSVVDVLRRARLAKAHRMLETTHRTISEVAYDTGFSSPSYFAKCFKDEYGITPGDFISAEKK